MGAKYWLKLYHEMLDDPKVARLPDSSYRRFIECILLAGELDEAGYLPPVMDMAWRLRLDEATLTQDLARLASSELLEIKPDGRWFVTSFEKRQKGLTKQEYMQRLRDERRVLLEVENEPVTNGNGKVTKPVTNSKTDKRRIDKDKDKIEKPENAAGAAFTAYADNIGGLTPIISDNLGDLIDEYGADTIIEAIHEAVKYNGRSLKYITAILDRWAKDGKGSREKKVNIYPEVKGFMTGSVTYKSLSPLAQEFVKLHGGNDLKRISPNSFEDNQIKREAANYVQ